MSDKRIEDTDGLTAEERAELIRRLSEDNTESIPLKDVIGEERYAEFLRMRVDDNDGWE